MIVFIIHAAVLPYFVMPTRMAHVSLSASQHGRIHSASNVDAASCVSEFSLREDEHKVRHLNASVNDATWDTVYLTA